MAQSNRYFRFSKLSEARFRRLVKCFALDLTATQTAELTGISVRSVNAIFLRRKIAAECERESALEGVLEADESYFGPRRVRGRHGRGGLRALVVHAKDDEARKYYENFDFQPSPTDPLHLYALVKDIQKSVGSGSGP